MRAPRPSAAPAAVVAFLLAAAGCQPANPASAPPVPTPTPVATQAPASAPATETPAEPSATPGFAFDPESVAGYYTSMGYGCQERQPSSQAAGYEFQSCQLVDADGRTRTVGFVTDPNDDLADAFMRISGAAGETVLDPAAVLEQFAGFLGATLGEAYGSAMLPWLAGALGDAYTTTTLGDLTIATYTDGPKDHATLSLELANPGYLDSPRPSASGAS